MAPREERGGGAVGPGFLEVQVQEGVFSWKGGREKFKKEKKRKSKGRSIQMRQRVPDR